MNWSQSLHLLSCFHFFRLTLPQTWTIFNQFSPIYLWLKTFFQFNFPFDYFQFNSINTLSLGLISTQSINLLVQPFVINIALKMWEVKINLTCPICWWLNWNWNSMNQLMTNNSFKLLFIFTRVLYFASFITWLGYFKKH